MRRVNPKIIVSILLLLVAVVLALKFLFFPSPEPTVTLGGKSYSVADSELGALLDYPEATEVLQQHLPGITDIRQVTVARPMTLIELKPFYPEIITDTRLQHVDELLRQLKGMSVVVYTTGSTQVGILLDDPEAKAILDKHLPGFSSNPQIDQGRGFTLSFMQKFDSETITDEILAAINTDFKALAISRAEGQ